jgi:hypothetical protein
LSLVISIDFFILIIFVLIIFHLPLIKNGSPPPASIDINLVLTLPAEFREIDEEIAQLYLGPRED